MTTQPEHIIIFQTDYWRVTLAEDQYYLGRAYVTLNREAGDLKDLTDQELLDFRAVVDRYETMARQAFGAVVFNWSCLMNHAFRTKPYNPHIHWHVRPRYDQPVEFAGQTFTDKEFGEHYARSTDHRLTPTQTKQLLAELKKAAP